MITRENVTLNGRAFVHTYSDEFYIERDGIQYAEAYDPAEYAAARVYTETAAPLEPADEPTPEPDGEATAEDYGAALGELGVL